MFKHMITFAAVVGWVFALAPAAQASLLTGPGGIVCPTGAHPTLGRNWTVGDTYQLIFVTSTARTAASSDMAVYNAFVQAAADAAGLGASVGVEWRAVASTNNVNARDNAAITGLVYNMALELVGDISQLYGEANNVNDVYYTEYVVKRPGDSVMWTGSTRYGLKWESGLGGNMELGRVMVGTSDDSGNGWLEDGGRRYNRWPGIDEFPLYSLSSTLTIIPEPATMVLLGLGGMGMLLGRRRGRA